jgi:hypothetical protein
MQTWQIITIAMLLIFTTVGFAIVVLPPRTILQYDRRTGYSIYKNAPDEQKGLKRAGCFYKFFGLAVVLFSVCFLVFFSQADLIEPGGQGGKIHARFVTSAGTAQRYESNRYPPYTYVYSFPPGTQTVIVYFYAKSNKGGNANYRWFFQDELVEEYEQRYINGFNHVELHAKGTYMPPGIHVVEITEQNGTPLATVKFKVNE